tara:strand:- start:14 stop:1036 length:1023 start_codon:yes stop_codon:yes gene_type:complete
MRFLLFYILLFCFTGISSQSLTPLSVAQGSFKISGLSDEEQYFGFAEGDQITFSYHEEKGKDLREIEVIEYPNTSRYTDFKFSKVNHTLIIPKTGIYCFKLTNGAIGGRTLKYEISRVPASAATVSFNTAVNWQTHHDTTWVEEVETYLARDEYVPQVIVPSSDFYINSGSNADFKGGKSRVVVPISIPENTVKWYYSFSAFREAEQVDNLHATFSLAGQLTRIIDQTGTLEFGVELLTLPPGADYCDIYLLDHNNSILFTRKEAYQYFTVGSRENLKSGISEITGGSGRVMNLGLRNPDYQYGINVVLEVVAIIHEEEYAERYITVPKVNIYKTPYLNN